MSHNFVRGQSVAKTCFNHRGYVKTSHTVASQRHGAIMQLSVSVYAIKSRGQISNMTAD